MKKYNVDIYKEEKENSLRFILGKKGKRPLIAVGLNPSTADENKPDMTISKIIGFAEKNGYDGFVMLNLYPQRATFPKDLPENVCPVTHLKNIKAIVDCLNEFEEVNLLAAWGEPIKSKPYLFKCLCDLKTAAEERKANWWQIGTMTKSGHPRHPSRAAYDLGINSFCIESYLKAPQS